MKYIMVSITDEYDYDIHDDVTCSTLKAFQRTMENYLKLDALYPKFLIETGSFHDGLLQVTSTDYIYTTYKKVNGIEKPIMEIRR